MIIKETPWFAVPVGALVLLGHPLAWWRLSARLDAEHVVLETHPRPGQGTSQETRLTVAPSDPVPMAVPDLVDILTMFARVGLPVTPLAIDVPAAQLDIITKKPEITWLSRKLTR